MFEIPQILKYLSFISYLGFIISSISGFVAVTGTFNLCQFIISLVVITNISIIMFYEITKQIEYYIQNLNYFRAYVQVIISLLILGLSPLGVGFGIYGIIIGLINIFIGILCLEPIINTPNIRESTIETP